MLRHYWLNIHIEELLHRVSVKEIVYILHYHRHEGTSDWNHWESVQLFSYSYLSCILLAFFWCSLLFNSLVSYLSRSETSVSVLLQVIFVKNLLIRQRPWSIGLAYSLLWFCGISLALCGVGECWVEDSRDLECYENRAYSDQQL